MFREECFETNVKFSRLIQTTYSIKHNEYIHDINKLEHINGTVGQNLSKSTSNNVFNENEKTFNTEKCCDIIHETSQGSLVDAQPTIEISVNNSSFNKGSETLICRICHKVFGSKYSLSEHNKVHLDAEKFKCKLCGKQFTRWVYYV